jgi:hypothetical protein
MARVWLSGGFLVSFSATFLKSAVFKSVIVLTVFQLFFNRLVLQEVKMTILKLHQTNTCWWSKRLAKPPPARERTDTSILKSFPYSIFSKKKSQKCVFLFQKKIT